MRFLDVFKVFVKEILLATDPADIVLRAPQGTLNLQDLPVNHEMSFKL